MGITRDRTHKRRKTGGRREQLRKKRKFELGRPPSLTKLVQGTGKRVHVVRVRGGGIKLRALRLDTGNFSWPSRGIARKTRIIDTVYNASNNELVRTKTLVKNAIVLIDATPFRQWYESHYLLPLARRKEKKAPAAKAADAAATAAPGEAGKADAAKTDAPAAAAADKPEGAAATAGKTEAGGQVSFAPRSKKTMKKYLERQKKAEVPQSLIEQFASGRLYACITSRPGQCGRADGYVLEGKELDFYVRKIKAKKAK